jgi:hypothetical protein
MAEAVDKDGGNKAGCEWALVVQSRAGNGLRDYVGNEPMNFWEVRKRLNSSCLPSSVLPEHV